MNKILIVDDMQVVYDLLKERFPNSDYSSNLNDALQRIRSRNYEQVITDFHLGKDSPQGGLEVVRTASEKGIAKIILMSSQDHEEEALKAGAHEFYFKKELFEDGGE